MVLMPVANVQFRPKKKAVNLPQPARGPPKRFSGTAVLVDEIPWDRRRPNGFLAGMDDPELLSYARRAIVQKEVLSPRGLQKIDSGLYSTLCRRRIIDRVVFAEKKRSWAGVSDETVIAEAHRFMLARGIATKRGLQCDAEGGRAYYKVLSERGLLGRVEFVEGRDRYPANWDEDRLVEYSRNFVRENGITDRGMFQEKKVGLYRVLQQRRLLDRVGVPARNEIWAGMSDEQLVAHANRTMREQNLKYRTHLPRGIYSTLSSRKLLGRVQTEGAPRRWAVMDDAALAGHAKRFMEENGITGRNEFTNAAPGLCKALRKRGLLGRLEFEDRAGRSWAPMSDGRLLEYAREAITQHGITTRHKLGVIDKNLYEEVRRRGLLNSLGLGRATVDWAGMGDGTLLKAARDFMAKEGITTSYKLELANPGIYGALRRRKLLGRAGFERTTAGLDGMDDKKLLAHARSEMSRLGLATRTQLQKKATGIYGALRARGLLDAAAPAREGRWMRFTDSALAGYARQMVRANRLPTMAALKRHSPSLAYVLERRRLAAKVGFAGARGRWQAMGDGEIVAYACWLMKKERITSRRELIRAGGGLYFVLRKRGLLGKLAFTRDHDDFRNMADSEIRGYADSFIAAKRIASMGDLKKRHTRLYWALWRGCMLSGILPGDGRFSWMTDYGLRNYAHRIMRKNALTEPEQLRDGHPDVYAALGRRGLLDFSWMSEKELTSHAARMMEMGGISRIEDLKAAQPVLHSALRKRGLLDAVGTGTNG